MIIPAIGDWVCCFGMFDGVGKVTKVNFDRSEFTADFLTEPNFDGSSSTEEITCSFSQIKKTVIDSDEIKRLENELVGL